MAIPKSTNERIRRKIRLPKVGPSHKLSKGKVVVKKSGDNDPRRNKKKKIAKEFVEYYKGKGYPKKNFNMIVEKLIERSIYNEGNSEFNLSRLSEMREEISKL